MFLKPGKSFELPSGARLYKTTQKTPSLILQLPNPKGVYVFGFDVEKANLVFDYLDDVEAFVRGVLDVT